MDLEMQKKIDNVLARIKEPQSELPIVDLGLVEKVTYSAQQQTLLLRLAIGTPRWQCPACSAINGVVKAGIVRRAQEAFEAAFPELKIIIE